MSYLEKKRIKEKDLPSVSCRKYLLQSQGIPVWVSPGGVTVALAQVEVGVDVAVAVGVEEELLMYRESSYPVPSMQ